MEHFSILLLRKSILLYENSVFVVQGPLGYGCTRMAEPERGAWIKHGLGLEKNEFLKSSKTAEGPKFGTRTAVQVRGIKRDWEEWRQECVKHDEDILPARRSIQSTSEKNFGTN